MKQQKVCGRDQQAKGRVKEAAGIVTGDQSLQRAGARQRNESVAEAIKESPDSPPLP